MENNSKPIDERVKELEDFAKVVAKTMTTQANTFQELVNSFNSFQSSIIENMQGHDNSIKALIDADAKLFDIIKTQGNSLQSFADTDKALIERIQWLYEQIDELNKKQE